MNLDNLSCFYESDSACAMIQAYNAEIFKKYSEVDDRIELFAEALKYLEELRCRFSYSFTERNRILNLDEVIIKLKRYMAVG